MELFDQFLQKLKNKEPFSFVRYGDGELNSLLQIDGENYKNTDGHTYFADMGVALADILKNKPKYYLGKQRFGFDERYPEQISKFLKDNDLENLNWVNADVFHHASINGYFEKFFDMLVKRDDPVILVGPKYLENLGKFYNSHVVVPDRNCWLKVNEILEDVRGHLDRCDEHKVPAVVLFVASMPANYMIDQLYGKYGSRHTLIDCGSVFDPYCGQVKRGYHKKIIERLNGKKI